MLIVSYMINCDFSSSFSFQQHDSYPDVAKSESSPVNNSSPSSVAQRDVKDGTNETTNKIDTDDTSPATEQRVRRKLPLTRQLSQEAQDAVTPPVVGGDVVMEEKDPNIPTTVTEDPSFKNTTSSTTSNSADGQPQMGETAEEEKKEEANEENTVVS